MIFHRFLRLRPLFKEILGKLYQHVGKFFLQIQEDKRGRLCVGMVTRNAIVSTLQVEMTSLVGEILLHKSEHAREDKVKRLK